MKILLFLLVSICSFCFSVNSFSNPQPYSIELEQINMPGTPAIHSFAFAQSNGKWLFIGGRTNGLHGFNALNAFPKQYANKNIFVVDPNTLQTWSRDIFTEFPLSATDPLRSTNMQFVQDENKLILTGGYGFDSASGNFITFPVLTMIDVDQMIEAVISGDSLAPFMRWITDDRIQVCGGELSKLGDYFYLKGGHKFTGNYQRVINDQVYTNQIKKFKLNDDGINISITDYSTQTDNINFHRRDMNVVPAIKPDDITPYLIWYGGVFTIDGLPFLNPVYIDENGGDVDYTFEQKMSQYTCAIMPVYSAMSHSMHTTFFGGMSLYYYDEISQTQVYDGFIPFIDDITTLARFSNGTSEEKIDSLKLPALLGSNAEFILNPAIPHYSNEVIKLDELTGRAFAGYIFGGIMGTLPNNGPSYPSSYIFKVYITPDFPLPVELTTFTSIVNTRNVLLKWSTVSEQSNAGFDLERSFIEKEGHTNDWKKVTFINGYGNTNILHNYFYEDKHLTTGKYKYRLKQIDYNGNFKYYDLSNEVIINSPTRYFLSQNYPNPFNPATKIDFEIPTTGNVSLKIYDNKGAEVKTLVDELKAAGYYSVEFSGSDLASGVYFYKIVTNSPGGAGNFVDVKKMFLVK